VEVVVLERVGSGNAAGGSDQLAGGVGGFTVSGTLTIS